MALLGLGSLRMDIWPQKSILDENACKPDFTALFFLQKGRRQQCTNQIEFMLMCAHCSRSHLYCSWMHRGRRRTDGLNMLTEGDFCSISKQWLRPYCVYINAAFVNEQVPRVRKPEVPSGNRFVRDLPSLYLGWGAYNYLQVPKTLIFLHLGCQHSGALHCYVNSDWETGLT